MKWLDRAWIPSVALVAVCASAAPADPAGPAACVKEADDTARLACYDRAMGRSASAAQPKVDRIVAKVTAISQRTRGELVVTLDNGQVWAQKEPQYMPLEVGDQVTILAGALNSYRLVYGKRITPVTRTQ